MLPSVPFQSTALSFHYCQSYIIIAPAVEAAVFLFIWASQHLELCNNAKENRSMWRFAATSNWRETINMKLCSDHCTLLLTFVFLVFNVRLSSCNASTCHLFWSKLKIFTCKVSIICEFVTSWFVSLTLSFLLLLKPLNAFIQLASFTPHYSNEETRHRCSGSVTCALFLMLAC